MRTDPALHHDRRHTGAHDRLLQALIEQITELNSRVEYIEHTVDPTLRPPSEQERREVHRTRITSTALAHEIAEIGASLDSVIASIDATRDEEEPAPASSEPAVVDLASRPSTSNWRTASTRQAGWQPVATRRVV